MSAKPTIIQLLFRRVKDIISPREREALEKWKHEVLFKWLHQINKAPYVLLFIVLGVALIRGGMRDAALATRQAGSQEALRDDHPSLTFPEGRRVWLDTLAINEIMHEDGWILSKTSDTEIAYISLPPARDTSLKARYHTFYVPYGQSWHIMLPDSSKVQLGAGSELSYLVYPRVETSRRRSVILQEGQAFFDIATDLRRPFVVTTETGMITVLGTRFDVMTRPKKDGLRVVLTDGAIKLHYNDSKDSVTMHRGDGARIVKDKCILQQVDTGALCSWRSSQFDFDGKNMGQIMNDIEDWYGLDKSYFEGSLDTMRLGVLTGHISKTLLLRDLLDKMKDFDFKIEGKRVIINHSTK